MNITVALYGVPCTKFQEIVPNIKVNASNYDVTRPSARCYEYQSSGRRRGADVDTEELEHQAMIKVVMQKLARPPELLACQSHCVYIFLIFRVQHASISKLSIFGNIKNIEKFDVQM